MGTKVLPIDNYTNAIATGQADRAIAEFTDLPTRYERRQTTPSRSFCRRHHLLRHRELPGRFGRVIIAFLDSASGDRLL
jgi:hypothetical protein